MVGRIALPVHVFIVHLASSDARTANVSKLLQYLEQVGVESSEVIPAVEPADAGPMYSPGEWGCYQSHGVCLRRARGLPDGTAALILEDDIEFTVQPARMRAVIEDALTREWDLLYLGHSGWGHLRSWDAELMANQWLQVRGMIYGTTAYMVRPDGFARLVDDYDALAHESVMTGGGVGADGAFAELSYRNPTIVRLAHPTTYVEEVIGISSTIRDSPAEGRLVRIRRLVRRRVRNFLQRLR